MRHAHSHAILPPTLLPAAVLQEVSPAPSVSPSIANYPAGLAHDARNMLAAMDIYCELLSNPGVLNPQYRHLGEELRLLRESSSTLMDRLLILAIKPMAYERTVERSGERGGERTSETGEHALLSGPSGPSGQSAEQAAEQAGEKAGEQAGEQAGEKGRATAFPEEPSTRKPVRSVAAELQAVHRMLSALAGPKVQVELVTAEAPEGELRIAAVDFTRVLINLVRNAAEAMGTGGRILIAARTAIVEPSTRPAVLVSVEDNGPGIPLSLLERIFDLNSGAASGEQVKRRMSFRPRGLGLRIVRELVEGGGGIIRAARLPERGSRFEIVLPMVTIPKTVEKNISCSGNFVS